MQKPFSGSFSGCEAQLKVQVLYLMNRLIFNPSAPMQRQSTYLRHLLVEALEEKIKIEMEALKQKMASMQQEMGTLSDLDLLRDQAQEKRTMLDEETQMKHDQIQTFIEQLLVTLRNMYEKRLNENETYAQLSNLERKLRAFEREKWSNASISLYVFEQNDSFFNSILQTIRDGI
ncbi:hypothetical protein L9F63_027621, partial [Diploptera punctata]